MSESPRIHPATYWLIAGCLLGGVVVLFAYRENHNSKADAQWKSIHGEGPTVPPPFVRKLEKDLVAINRDGKKVQLSEMRGKLFIASYMFTDCPMGCTGNAAKLKEIYDEFGSDPRFKLVTFSVDPEGDTPEKSDEFLNNFGVGVDDWWYLTGEGDHINDYVRRGFLLSKPKKSDNPAIRIEHDMRVAIVDHKANVRGYYSLLHPQEEVATGDLRRLRQDVRYILDNEMPPAAPKP